MKTTQNFGATYNTTPGEDFGEITSIFLVDVDWDGYKYHGYCRPNAQELQVYFGE